MGLQPALFIGLVLSATSVSISARTLMEMKVLRSRVGIGMLGAAVFDDILVVLALSVFIALTAPDGGGGALGVLVILLRMLLYLVIFGLLGFLLFPRWTRRVGSLPVSQGLISFALVVLLVYGWAAEVVGNMAAITGAFLAGLLLGRTAVKERIESGMAALAYGLFVPVFFINVGLSADARQMGAASLLLFLAMSGAAIAGKILGAGLGANLSGMSRRESLQLGVGMISRGEVGLIVASVGVTQGLVDNATFSATVGVVILTTLLTPVMLRRVFPKPKPEPGTPPQDAKGESV
jgi:Kef-type K+ transport system membrane component KefB